MANVTSDALPLLEPNASSTGLTVTPKQIQDLPVNGREYLDLLQLVPGVAINRQSTGDNANPVLGERSGNNNFFIDGQPNKNTVTGGPAAAFNQETISEFQVLTTGYKAEFGQASGAIVNVITKSGGNAFHGVGSLFVRNEAFDSSNSLDPTVTEAPHLRRLDYSLAVGGPIWKDRIFFFGSSERITEDRGIDFKYPTFPATAASARLLALLHEQEDPLDGPQRGRETRNFIKFNETFGRHQLVQEMNYTNEYNRGAGNGIPSSRRNTSARASAVRIRRHDAVGRSGDTVDSDTPRRLSRRAVGQPARQRYCGANDIKLFHRPTSLSADVRFFCDCRRSPSVQFGSATTASNLHQEYTSFAANANKLFDSHDVKFGWQFLRTKVDGLDSSTLTNQIFATVDDYLNFGSVNGGIFLLLDAGPRTPEAAEIHLRNNYNGLYVQDDWRAAEKPDAQSRTSLGTRFRIHVQRKTFHRVWAAPGR